MAKQKHRGGSVRHRVLAMTLAASVAGGLVVVGGSATSSVGAEGTPPDTTTTVKPTTTTVKPTTTTTPPDSGQGCTPGYWKQPQHSGSWSGYSPTDSYDTVFGIDSGLASDLTLLQALQLGGGGEKALARHATAALLNSSNTIFTFKFNTAQVISMVQSAYSSGNFESTKNVLAAANEQGCTLGRADS